MNKNDVSSLVNKFLGEILIPEGFVFVKRESSYKRPIVGGSQRISYGLFDYHPEYVIGVFCAFRIEEVEDFCAPFEGILEKYRRETTTAVAQMSYFSNGDVGFERISASSEKELVAKLRPFLKFFSDKVLPVLNNCRDVIELEKLVNANGGVPFNGTFGLGSSMSAVVMACLANNPDVAEIVERKRALIAEFPDFQRQAFEDMVSQLRSSGWKLPSQL